jgi:hypothetical protein
MDSRSSSNAFNDPAEVYDEKQRVMPTIETIIPIISHCMSGMSPGIDNMIAGMIPSSSNGTATDIIQMRVPHGAALNSPSIPLTFSRRCTFSRMTRHSVCRSSKDG